MIFDPLFAIKLENLKDISHALDELFLKSNEPELRDNLPLLISHHPLNPIIIKVSVD